MTGRSRARAWAAAAMAGAFLFVTSITSLVHSCSRHANADTSASLRQRNAEVWRTHKAR